MAARRRVGHGQRLGQPGHGHEASARRWVGGVATAYRKTITRSLVQGSDQRFFLGIFFMALCTILACWLSAAFSHGSFTDSSSSLWSLR